jgi:hypothetical protein
MSNSESELRGYETGHASVRDVGLFGTWLDAGLRASSPWRPYVYEDKSAAMLEGE